MGGCGGECPSAVPEQTRDLKSMVTPRPHTELEGVGLCVFTPKSIAPVQVGDVILSFPFRRMGAEGGPNKVLLLFRPIYHHSPHHFCPQVCPSTPLIWSLAAFALGPQGLVFSLSIASAPAVTGSQVQASWSWVIGFVVFPLAPSGTHGPAWGGLCSCPCSSSPCSDATCMCSHS